MNESKEKKQNLVKLSAPGYRYEQLGIAITIAPGMCIEDEEAKDEETICFTVLYNSIEDLLGGFFVIRKLYGDDHYDINVEWP